MENISSLSKNHNESIEKALLGCLLLSSELIVVAVGKIDKTDFFYERNAFLFDQFCQIHEERGTFDVVLLTEKLRINDDFSKRNLGSYVIDLLDCSATVDNFLIYIEDLRKLSLLRKVEQLGHNLIEAGKKASDASTILISTERYIHDIFKLNDYNIIDVFSDLKKDFESFFDDNSRQILSGFRALDNILSLRPSEVTVIAARPGVGKTAFAVSCGINICNRKKNVLLFSLEMSSKQIMQRVLSNISDISLTSVQSGLLTAEEYERMNSSTQEDASKGKFLLVDKPNLGLAEIKSSSRTIHAQEKLDVIFVDYIQLINLSGSFESRQSEVTKIAQELKSLARELDIPIFVLSQLSRAAEQSKDRRPLLWHLKSSGSIEEHFDNVLFLYRPDYSGGEDQFVEEETEKSIFDDFSVDEKKTEIIIAKQRNGPTGRVFVKFLPSFSKFIDYDIAQDVKMY